MEKLNSYEDGSLFDHMQRFEKRTFLQMAKEFGVPAIFIEKRFREEATERGQLNYFFRSTLLRQLYHYVPNGIRRHGDWKLIRAISSWVGMVGISPELESYCRKVGNAIQNDKNVSEDWLPSSANDSVFLKYFEQEGLSLEKPTGT